MEIDNISASVLGSLVLWFAFVTVYNYMGPSDKLNNFEDYGVVADQAPYLPVYCQMLLAPVACMIPMFARHAYNRNFNPKDVHKALIFQKENAAGRWQGLPPASAAGEPKQRSQSVRVVKSSGQSLHVRDVAGQSHYGKGTAGSRQLVGAQSSDG